MRLHVPLELACLRAGVITQVALVWPLTCVTASVHNEVALEFENLATELTGFYFPWGLALSLGIRRAGRTKASLSGWLGRIAEKSWGLGTRLEKSGTQQTVHGWHTVGRERWCGPAIISCITCKFPQTPREVHGTWLHGGHPHHPLKGTGVLGQQPHLFRA